MSLGRKLMSLGGWSLGRKLMRRLPQVRGTYRADVPLHELTWLQVGGCADVLFVPVDENDLCFFLKNKPVEVPVTVIGAGSNLLVRDGGVRGVVVRLLGEAFMRVEVEGTALRVGAAARDMTIARVAYEASVAGLEFLCGIPGSMGGALHMNAGAAGREISQVFVEARGIDPGGTLHILDGPSMGFRYRGCGVAEGMIFTQAVLQGEVGRKKAIYACMEEILRTRAHTQPRGVRTAGSTFKNPQGHKAWQLIESAGCRGLQNGRARVSEHHCNFLINEGGARACELEDLAEDVRERVREKSGVHLEWEICRLGVL